MRKRELALLRPIRHNHEEVVVVRWPDEAEEVGGIRTDRAREPSLPSLRSRGQGGREPAM